MYLISDTHIGSGACDKEALQRMLNECKKNKDRVIMAGDGVDLWLRDWTFLLVESFDTIKSLVELTSTWVPGNHDIELRTLCSLNDKLKSPNFAYPSATIAIDGKRWLIEHGHLEGFLGWFFRAMDKLERTNLTRKIARWIVKNRLLSVVSRGTLYHESVKRALVKKAKDMKADVVIFGHTHIQDYEEIDGIAIVNPGALGQYAVYKKGKFSLHGER